MLLCLFLPYFLILYRVRDDDFFPTHSFSAAIAQPISSKRLPGIMPGRSTSMKACSLNKSDKNFMIRKYPLHRFVQRVFFYFFFSFTHSLAAPLIHWFQSTGINPDIALCCRFLCNTLFQSKHYVQVFHLLIEESVECHIAIHSLKIAVSVYFHRVALCCGCFPV